MANATTVFVITAVLCLYLTASQDVVPLLRFSAGSGVATDANGRVLSWTSVGQSVAVTSKLPSSHVVRVDGVLNGNPVIRFDGFSGEVLQGTTAVVPMSPPLILAVVANAAGPATGCCRNLFALGPEGSYGVSYSGAVGADGNGNLCMTTGTIIGQTPVLIRLRYAVNLSLVNSSLFLNGTSVEISCSGFSTLNPPNGTLQIGGRTFGNLPARVFSGDIADILYFVNASAVSNATINAVESTLALAYGVPRPGNAVSSSGQEIFSNTVPFRQCLVALGSDVPIQFDQRVAGSLLLLSSSLCPLLGLSTSANLSAPNPGARPRMPDGSYFVCGANGSSGVFAPAPWLNQAAVSTLSANRRRDTGGSREVLLQPPQCFSVVWRCEGNNRSLPSTVHLGFVVPSAFVALAQRGSLVLVIDTDGSSDGKFVNPTIVPLFRARGGRSEAESRLWTTRGPLESVPQGTMFWTFAVLPRSLSVSVSPSNLASSDSATRSLMSHSRSRASRSLSGLGDSVTQSNSSTGGSTPSFAGVSLTTSYRNPTHTAANHSSSSLSHMLGTPTNTRSHPKRGSSYSVSTTFEIVRCDVDFTSIQSSARRAEGLNAAVDSYTEGSSSTFVVFNKSLFVSTLNDDGTRSVLSTSVATNTTVNVSLTLSNASADRCYFRVPRIASSAVLAPEDWQATPCFHWNISTAYHGVDGVAVDSWIDTNDLSRIVVVFRAITASQSPSSSVGGGGSGEGGHDANTTGSGTFRLEAPTTLFAMFDDQCLAAIHAHQLCTAVETNFTFLLRAVPVAPPPPPPQTLPDATVTSKAVTAVVAAVTDPLVAMQANRASLAVLLLVCAQPIGEVPFYMSPLPMAVGISDLSFTAGAVVGNHVIILMFVLLQGIAAAVYFVSHDPRRRRHSPSGALPEDEEAERQFRMVRAMAVARFPSFTVYPVLFLQQSTVSVAVTSLAYGGGDVAVRAVGAVGCVLALVPLAVAYRVLRAPGGMPCRYHPDAQRNIHGRTLLSTFFFGSGKWIDTDDGLPSATKFKQRCQFLFADYTDRCPYFMLVEMSLNVVCGVIQGLIFPGQCKSLLFANGTAVALFLLIAVHLRPFVSWFQLCYCIVNCVMQLVSVGLSLAAVQYSVSDAFDVAVQFNGAAVYVTLLQALVGLWPRARRVSRWLARWHRFLGREESKAPFLSEALLRQHEGLDRRAAPPGLRVDEDDAVSLHSIATQPVNASARFDALSDEELLQVIERQIIDARVDDELVRDAATNAVRELRFVTIPGAALRSQTYRMERAVAVERCLAFSLAVRELLQRLSVVSLSATLCEKPPSVAEKPAVALLDSREVEAASNLPSPSGEASFLRTPSASSTVQLLRDLLKCVEDLSSASQGSSLHGVVVSADELRTALTSLLAAWGGQDGNEGDDRRDVARGLVLDSEVDVVRRDALPPSGFFDEGSEAAAVAAELMRRLEDERQKQRLAREMFDLGAGTELAEESLLVDMQLTTRPRAPSLRAPRWTMSASCGDSSDGALHPASTADLEKDEEDRRKNDTVRPVEL